MQTKVLHAVLSGIIMAIVLGFSLIPSTWQILGQEPTFGSSTNGLAIIGIVASVAIVAITLFSFKFVGRARTSN